MAIHISMLGGKISREFTEKIDIVSSVTGRFGQFSVHINHVQINNFAIDLFQRKLMETFFMKIRPCGNSHRCVIITPRDNVTWEATMILLNYLEAEKIAIKWKEGQHGYEIKKDGTIIRKWELKPSKIIDIGGL